MNIIKRLGMHLLGSTVEKSDVAVLATLHSADK